MYFVTPRAGFRMAIRLITTYRAIPAIRTPSAALPTVKSVARTRCVFPYWDRGLLLRLSIAAHALIGVGRALNVQISAWEVRTVESHWRPASVDERAQ